MNTEKKNSTDGLLKLIGFFALVGTFIVLCRRLFKTLNEKDCQKNYNSEIRRYISCFNALSEKVAKVEFHCLKLASFFSADTIDLSKADIGSELTIDISGFASAIKILLPKECNIVNVSDNKYSAIEYNEEYTEGAPTVTLVGKIRACAVSFTKAL